MYVAIYGFSTFKIMVNGENILYIFLLLQIFQGGAIKYSVGIFRLLQIFQGGARKNSVHIVENQGIRVGC